MRNIILLDSTPAGMAAIRAVKRLGYRATILCSSRFSPFYTSDNSKRFLAMADEVVSIADSLDLDEVRSAIASVNSVHKVDAIISTVEFVVPIAAAIASEFNIPFASGAAVDAARTKDRCRAIVEKAGVPPIPCKSVTNIAEAVAAVAEIGFPVIVKPSSGVASLGVRLVHNRQGINDYFHDISATLGELPMDLDKESLGQSFLVEEFVVGPPVSVEIGRTLGGTIVPFMLSQRAGSSDDPVQVLGTLMPSQFDETMTQACFDQAATILTALDLSAGIFHIEMIISAKGPRLVEVNPRIMGGNMTTLYELVTGRDIFESLIRIHLGEEIDSGWQWPPRYGCSLILAPAENGVIARLPDDAEREQLRQFVDALNINAPAGKSIQEYANGFGAIGNVLASAPDSQTALTKARTALNAISEIIGIGLK